MRRRRVPILIAVVVVIAAIAVAVYLRSRTAPEAARMLPSDADAVLYIDAGTIRRVAALAGQAPAVPHDPEYQKFIQETGFEFERDLDKVAFAFHAPKAQPGQAAASGDLRTSEIFVARFDAQRVGEYLRKLATYTERYRNTDIYNIPNEGHTVRVAILGVGTVAVSNTADSRPIEEMVDHYEEAALPFGGPELLRRYYHDVPTASLLWCIAHMAADNQPGGLQQPSTVRSLAPGAVVVGSVRWVGMIQLRADALAPSREEARRYADNAGTLLSLFRGAASGEQPAGTDPDVKQFFDSIAVEQNGDRAILKATLPIGFLKKIVAESPKLPEVEAPAAAAAPEKPAPKPKAKKAQ